jgi:hypothetical protein
MRYFSALCAPALAGGVGYDSRSLVVGETLKISHT